MMGTQQQTISINTTRTLTSTIKFSQFATLCDGIANRPPTKKREMLKSFLETWRKEYKLLYPTNPQPPPETFFPIMRLLLPEADRDRPTYGIKEHVLARLLIDEMGLNVSGDAAQMLIHWKKNKPRNANSADVSDFAGVAYFVLQDRTRKEGEISIAEVNEHLDALAEANTVGGEERKTQNKALVHTFFTRMNAGELKWLIRVILKDLKLGMGQGPILDTFHSDAKDLFDVCNSLSTVCGRLNDPEIRMSEMDLSLFSFIRPMLADTWRPDKLRVLLKSHENSLIAEIKYDGERVQIHKKGNQFKYFSRGGHDISEDLGATSTEGNLTRHIADCFRPDAHTFIIDGEIVPYSLREKCIATKAESNSIKSLTGSNGYQVCFVAFDILLFNDLTLTAKPLKSRQQVLKELFQEEEGRLYHAVRKNVKTPDDCYQYLNEAVDRDEEGIIIKDLTTVYKPNKRDAGWYKIKPEYVENLSDQLDVLVVGGYYGTGRRSGGPSHFLLAVAQASDLPGTYPSKFLSFCKVGSGYTMEELQEMNMKLDKHWRKWTATSPPTFLQLAPGEKEKADLWVEPKHSFIVKISAAELLESDTFATGCTLRFPRMKEARNDKPWYDCMTLAELLALKEESRGRLGARNVTDDHLTGEGSPRKRQKINNRAPVLQLASESRPADLRDVDVTGNIFNEKEFYIAGDAPGHSKQDLERLVAENGGICVQQPSAGTFCAISQKKTVRVTNAFNQMKIDVVLPAWLVRCAEAGALLPWQPDDLLYATEKTTKMIKSAFDKYGDSYTAPITELDFERLLTEMENEKIVSKEKIASFEEDYLQDFPLMGLFRLCSVYIDKFEIIGDSESQVQCGASLALAEEYIAAYGGHISDVIDENVTHVIVHHSGDFCRLDELKKMNNSRKNKFYLVTDRWVLDSVEKVNVREERGYIARRPMKRESFEKFDVFAGLF